MTFEPQDGKIEELFLSPPLESATTGLATAFSAAFTTTAAAFLSAGVASGYSAAAFATFAA